MVVGCPAAEPGDTSMSMRFSLTQMGDTRPSGHWIGVNRRVVDDDVTIHPGDAGGLHLLGELVEDRQRVAGGLDRAGDAEIGVAVV